MKIKKLSLLFSGIISVGAITPVVYAYSTSKNTKHEMSVKSKILTYIERKTKVDYAYAESALTFASGVTLTIMTFIKLVISKM